MNKALFFLTLISLMMFPYIVKANDVVLYVELDSCVKHLPTMTKSEINEMVVALHLGKKHEKHIFGTEMLNNEDINTAITSRSILLSNNALKKNVVNIKIDGINYACYPKKQK